MELKKYYNYNQLKHILWNIRTSAQFFSMKKGSIYSYQAELYLNALNEYTKYLIPEMIEDFKNNTRQLIYSPFIPEKGVEISTDVQTIIDKKDKTIIDEFYNIMNALEIMKIYDETNSWEEVDKIIQKQAHSYYTFYSLMNIMILYSKIGVLFIDKYGGNPLKENKNKYEDKPIVFTLKRRVVK